MEWLYAVTVIRKMSSLDDGHLWNDMMPDELHQKKYNFDGWEVEVRTDKPPNVKDLKWSETNEVQGRVTTYELFWYPKTFELATELLELLHSMREHTLFEGCDYKLTIMPKTW
tara:strand:+ start:2286 stop:2624 length:339 start_codon:yes stop_codon:yes gene_type:complete